MGLRVHELAKELKISTSALKVHLTDLGVTVKSHMSIIEDDIVQKIRKKFQDQVAAIRKRETDRKRYQSWKKAAAKQQEEERKREQEAEAKKPLDKVEKAKQEIPTFVERPLKKAPPSRPVPTAYPGKTEPASPTVQPPASRPGTPEKPEKKVQPEVEKRSALPKKEPVVGDKEVVIPDSTTVKPATPSEKRFTKSKKVDSVELGSKSKHIQAKLKHTNKRKGRKTAPPSELEQAEISRAIKKTLSKTRKKKKYRREDKQSQTERPNTIEISEFTSVGELAKIIDIPPTDIIRKFFELGQMVTINQRLDKESLEMIGDEYDLEMQFEEEYGTEIIEEQQRELHEEAEDLPRPPVVTIMGHVDHGKTSILDYIRSANVIAGEAGGITQHIGAYQVTHNEKRITFIDTPGHEAFTAMRARGANVTDIAIIVVAANDGVKPQTVEAIDHAKAAGVTMIVAINKIDLPSANVDRTINGLAEQNVFLENYGGDVLWTQTSATTGEGISDLLDLILLASEMNELTAKQDVPGRGIVIEAEKDPQQGAKTTIMLQEGTLTRGDSFVCGATYGRVRRMENERGREIEKLEPSDVAILYGLSSVPKAGDILNVVENEKTARQISGERRQIRHERERYQAKTSLSNLFRRIKEDQMDELKLIIKADSDGSMEALCDSFLKLSNEEISVNIIRKGVGGIIEADVNLAATTEAIIFGFHVRANNQAKRLAEETGVEIKYYQIIYDAIDDVRMALEGMLEPESLEVNLGTARVKKVFKIRKLGAIAGCAVENGVIRRDALVRLYRNDQMIFEGRISSLKHYNEEAQEIRAGTECGIGIHNFNDIHENDIIEAYHIEEVKRKL